MRNTLGEINVLHGLSLTYPVIHDEINYPNENANMMSTVCIEQGMIVMNNLKFNEKFFLK